MAPDPVELGREVIRACRALGFALAGIVEAAPTSREGELHAWLAAGKHGEMDWMTELLEERLDPRGLIPPARARSLIMVADQYAARGSLPPRPPTAPREAAAGRIARYAQGKDYHAVIKRRLHRLADQLRKAHAGHEFRSFVDTGPVLEREHAARAGMGWIGKHTLLIHPRLGSYLLLGGIATTLELRAPTAPIPPTATTPPVTEMTGIVPDHCGTCTRCIDACPTGAITPYAVDARRCISYLTIEHAGAIDRGLQARMGEWIFGCDVCQEVCPFNGPGQGGVGGGGSRVHPAYVPVRESLPLTQLLAWDQAGYQGAVTGSALKRATLAMLQRNAAIARRNSR